MNIREKWNSDEKFLMNGGKYRTDFEISWYNGMRRYIFKFVMNKVYQVQQCEETEFMDCVHSDDIDKSRRPMYYCIAVSYFDNKFGDEVKQFDLY